MLSTATKNAHVIMSIFFLPLFTPLRRDRRKKKPNIKLTLLGKRIRLKLVFFSFILCSMASWKMVRLFVKVSLAAVITWRANNMPNSSEDDFFFHYLHYVMCEKITVFAPYHITRLDRCCVFCEHREPWTHCHTLTHDRPKHEWNITAGALKIAVQ